MVDNILMVAAETGGSTGMEAVTGAITSAFDMVTSLLNSIVGNPILVVLFAMGTFIPIGLRILRKVKNTSKG